MQLRTTQTLTTLALLGLAATAHAQTFSATNGGDETTSKSNNTTSYANVNGSGSSAPQYAVLDFATTAPTSNDPVTSLTFNLYDEGYKFGSGGETAGSFDVYLTNDTTTVIRSSSLRYDSGASTLAGSGTSGGTGVAINDGANVTDGFAQGSSLYFLGTEAFTPQAANSLDQGIFTLSTAASNYLTSQYASSGTVRLVVAPDTNTPGIVYSYFGYNPAAGNIKPAITLTTTPAVAPAPEPSGWVAMLVGMGALGLIVARRRTQQAA